MDIHVVRERLQELILSEESKKTVTVEGETLEDAITVAAAELAVPRSHVEYELLQKPSQGIFGIAQRSCILRANVVATEKLHGPHVQETISQISNSGTLTVKLTSDYDVLLKVTKPSSGDGQHVTFSDAVRGILLRTTAEINEQQITTVVKKATGKFIKVGTFEHDILKDARINCIISEDNMKAEIVVTAPGLDGMDVSTGQILAVLKEQGVVHGIKNDLLKQLEESPRYGTLLLVAEGDPAIPGKDAEIVYLYLKEKKVQEVKDPGEAFDYKEILHLPNVEAGAVIAEKRPPEEGKPGVTIKGRYLMPEDGSDVEIKVGNNVILSDDRKQVSAAVDGLVRIGRDGAISVDPIYVVNGDVNIRTGNIHFLGSVIVRGNVEDGFTVEAKANIVVFGLVGKAVLKAGGNIAVHRGIAGKGGAKIISGDNVLARFIENSYVLCANILSVSDGIINSTVLVQNSVLCRGKRANIIAGHIIAKNYIEAKNIGSSSGNRTVVEVGFEPNAVLQIRKLRKKQNILTRQLANVRLNFNTLASMLKRMQQTAVEISQEKKEQFEQLLLQKNELEEELRNISDELRKLEVQIESDRVEQPMISTLRKVHPGTIVRVLNKPLDVRREYTAISFYTADNIVQVKSYIEVKLEAPEL